MSVRENLREERRETGMEEVSEETKEMELENKSLGDLDQGGERREGKARGRTREQDFEKKKAFEN